MRKSKDNKDKNNPGKIVRRISTSNIGISQLDEMSNPRNLTEQQKEAFRRKPYTAVIIPKLSK